MEEWQSSLCLRDSTECRTDWFLCPVAEWHELKAPGKTPRALQLKRKRQLERLGFRVYVVDGVEQIGGVLREIQST